MNTLNTAYSVKVDTLETESGISIEDGTLHMYNGRLRLHSGDEIKDIGNGYYVHDVTLNASEFISASSSNYTLLETQVGEVIIPKEIIVEFDSRGGQGLDDYEGLHLQINLNNWGSGTIDLGRFKNSNSTVTVVIIPNSSTYNPVDDVDDESFIINDSINFSDSLVISLTGTPTNGVGSTWRFKTTYSLHTFGA